MARILRKFTQAQQTMAEDISRLKGINLWTVKNWMKNERYENCITMQDYLDTQMELYKRE